MRLYSDIISGREIRLALDDIKHIAPSVGIDDLTSRKGRKRAYSHNVCLEGWGARHTRQANFGRDCKAATWMDWGWFLAVLFRHDPEMVAPGHYDGQDDFLDKTERDVRWRIQRDRSVKNFARDHAAWWPNTHTDHPDTAMVSPFTLVDKLCPPERLHLPWTPEAIENYLSPWSVPRIEAHLAS